MKNTELLAVGSAYVDLNGSGIPFSSSGLVPEIEVVGREYEVVPGGSAVNFARLCSALELPTTFIGKTGRDTMGSMLADLLRQAGVGPELIVDAGVMTNVGINLANDNGESIMVVVGSANQSLTADEVLSRASEKLKTCSHFFIGGCFKLKSLLPAFDELVTLSKSTDTLVVLDHARLNAGVTDEEKELVRSLALRADYYLPSASEFQELWGVSSIEEGLRQVASEAEGTIVVKDSFRGAVTLVNGDIVRVPAFEVKPIHTVGAGDSFNAGFIASQSLGEDLLASIRFGCATAALKISQTELPTRQSVEAFIAEPATTYGN